MNAPFRILIVDDDPGNVRLLGALLEPNHEVLVALNGEQALERIGAHNPPDLILLDVVMPGISGYEICRQIKSDKATADIPVIFITSRESDSDEEEGLRLGAVDFITKPIRPAVVGARIETQLKLLRQQYRLRESEALLKATLESTRDGIVVINPDYQIILANQRLRQMWGVPAELIEQGDAVAIANFCRPQLTDGETLIAQGIKLVESRSSEEKAIHFKDGRVYQRFSSPLPDSAGFDARVFTYTDITDQYRLKEQLVELSVTDALTGLYNRRKLIDILQRELQRAHRYEYQLGALLIDIDHFKQVNDRHGHAMGDEVLIALSQVMRQNLREVDIAFRLGGEEFLILMPKATMEGVASAGERLRKKMAVTTVGEIQVTISAGAATSDQINDPDIPQLLIELADRALYQAKNNGRNRVCIATQADL